MQLIYGIRSGKFIKVGVTEDLYQRLEALRLHNPHPMHIAFLFNVIDYDAYRIEAEAHRILAKRRHMGEWFATTDGRAERAVLQATDIVRQRPQPLSYGLAERKGRAKYVRSDRTAALLKIANEKFGITYNDVAEAS